MEVSITVGDVEVRLDGLDLDKHDVVKLLRAAARIAKANPPEPEPEPTTSVGFTAHLERAPDYREQDLDWYFEDKNPA